MDNKQVLKNFIEREEGATALRTIYDNDYKYKGRTLQTDGNELINYDTIIAKHIDNNTIELNVDYYSSTTSNLQFALARLINNKCYNVILKNTAQINKDRLNKFITCLSDCKVTIG